MMRRSIFGSAFLVAAVVASGAPPREAVEPVPSTAVRVTGGFWAVRLDANRRVTLPHCMKLCEETGRIDNFAVAGKRKDGEFKGYFFNDSDVFKVLEGAAHCLATERDPALEAQVDAWIELIAAAQEPDGYLYCSRTICTPGNMPPGGRERWSNMADGHELYNVGHLYEAAVAHHRATGKRSLLDVAIRNADLVCDVFGPGRNPHPCGHPEIELALVKLSQATGNERYLKQAHFFLEARGRGDRKLFGEYAQDHRPLVEQPQAVGHAVRAAYVYAGMADVAALGQADGYRSALERLWKDVVSSKIYLTGGIGARAAGEAFGDPYELPNVSAYAETCGSIAQVLWSQRMFQLTGEAHYVDVLEQALLNGMLAGVSLRGDRFFYPNPLASHRGAERQPWFPCACCPSNVVRFLPQVPGMVYGRTSERLYVNLFMQSQAEFELAGGPLRIEQTTDYPWEGKVALTLDPGDTPREFEIWLRLPEWSRGASSETDLYRTMDPPSNPRSLTLNGESLLASADDGYVWVRRAWKKGDRLEWDLGMSIQRIQSHPQVEANKGRVALQRGPLVYCVEEADLSGVSPMALVLADDSEISAEARPDLLGEVTVLRGTARTAQRRLDGQVELSGSARFQAVPYYTWANRQRGAMTVWLARDPNVARVAPAPTLAGRARLSASFGPDPDSARDQIEPASSADQESTRWHWWPHKGTAEWLQINLAKKARVTAVEVYWFDDTGAGQCRLPQSWRLLFRDGDEWREVQSPSGYGTAANLYNRTTFAPVVTESLRMEIQSAEGFAGGIHELRIIGEDEQPPGGWAPANGPLRTRWTAQVDPARVLPEYPRPLMVRKTWENLNGVWQFARAGADEPPPIGRDLSGSILVPFPIESALSGVMESAERVWYRRQFEAPRLAFNQRLLLHFEAVDWEARVWVNGVEMGVHQGGYDPFSFDITDALKRPGLQEVIVGVYDPTDAGPQPRGKQVRRPEGIWYTSTTGIWQTVWLEVTPEYVDATAPELAQLAPSRVRDLVISGDPASGAIEVRSEIDGPAGDLGIQAELVVRDQGTEIGRVSAPAGETLRVVVPKPRAWSPDDPHLYDLRITLLTEQFPRGPLKIDRVESYVGLRSVGVGPDEQGVPRLLLNGRPCFQVGPLDQGYWPDGLVTQPSDEALRYDLEITKKLGFNMTRKHVKVEARRWYAHADRLGLLVWQDMPNGNNDTPEGRQQFERELRRMIESLRNHPSIVMWVVFNEGWGQYDTRRIVQDVRRLDPSRLLNNASGWTDADCGDVLDIHNYPAPSAPQRSGARAGVLGEFGGLGLAVPGHLWKPQHWGYQGVADSGELTEEYERFMQRVYALRDSHGLSAAVYTQLTDVEIECNGLLTYDRQIMKPDVERIAAANRGDFSRMPQRRTLVAAADEGPPAEWAYRTEPPPAGWFAPEHDDAAWARGRAGFGTRITPGARVGTEWNSGEIWLRRSFELPAGFGREDVRLWVHHDEDAEIFINGVRAARLTGYTTEYRPVSILPEARAALRAGANLIAIHCRQTRGGQYIDAGLCEMRRAAAGRE